MIRDVVISASAKKDLRKVPRHVAIKLKAWVELVESNGLDETRKIPGFHDEPLRGTRKGERSIRLSRAYRAFYVVEQDGSVRVVVVQEVNKHEY